MHTRIRPNMELPPPIVTYFAAAAVDVQAVGRCFTEDGVVVDEGRTHRGRIAIARWKADATAKYHYASEPVSADVSGAEAIVTARVSGDFPGSPVTLRYRFTLEGRAIARLEITA
jgi:ketosteroid isomerase-like protein